MFARQSNVVEGVQRLVGAVSFIGRRPVRTGAGQCPVHDRLGFDIVELSSGFLAIGTDDMVRMTEVVASDYELDPKPEINVQF